MERANLTTMRTCEDFGSLSAYKVKATDISTVGEASLSPHLPSLPSLPFSPLSALLLLSLSQ